MHHQDQLASLDSTSPSACQACRAGRDRVIGDVTEGTRALLDHHTRETSRARLATREVLPIAGLRALEATRGQTGTFDELDPGRPSGSRPMRRRRNAVCERHRGPPKISESFGMPIAGVHHMTHTWPRTIFAVLVVSGLDSCSRPTQPPVIGPPLGESTAQGPTYPIGSPPDAMPEVSASLHGPIRPIANVAPATAATPPATEPTAPATEQIPATVWTPSLPPASPPPKSTGSNGRQPPPSMPPGNGPVRSPPIVTARPPPGTPPSAPPNGPGSGASPTPAVPHVTGNAGSGGASGTPPSTPGG